MFPFILMLFGSQIELPALVFFTKMFQTFINVRKRSIMESIEINGNIDTKWGNIQKQLQEAFCKNGALRIFVNLTRKHFC